MNKKRLVWRAMLVLCVVLVLCRLFLIYSKGGEITLSNESGEAVIKAAVEINGRKFDIANFPPGAVRKLKFKLEKDNHYTISVEFPYERKLDAQAGYFSGGEPNHQLVIKSSGVVFESGE